MIVIARVLGRLLAVLTNKQIITSEEADYILAPFNENEILNHALSREKKGKEE